jgi:hypothetical protein
MRSKFKNSILVICALMFISCNGEDDSSSEVTNQQIDASVYQSQELVEYGGATAYLDSHLYVNDQPSIAENLREFIGVLTLYTIENTMPDTNISNVRLYVLENNTVLWMSEESTEISENSGDNSVEIVFREGPQDLRYKLVDVVLEFVFNGETIRISQKSLYVKSVV